MSILTRWEKENELTLHSFSLILWKILREPFLFYNTSLSMSNALDVEDDTHDTEFNICFMLL